MQTFVIVNIACCGCTRPSDVNPAPAHARHAAAKAVDFVFWPGAGGSDSMEINYITGGG